MTPHPSIELTAASWPDHWNGSRLHRFVQRDNARVERKTVWSCSCILVAFSGDESRGFCAGSVTAPHDILGEHEEVLFDGRGG